MQYKLREPLVVLHILCKILDTLEFLLYHKIVIENAFNQNIKGIKFLKWDAAFMERQVTATQMGNSPANFSQLDIVHTEIHQSRQKTFRTVLLFQEACMVFGLDGNPSLASLDHKAAQHSGFSTARLSMHNFYSGG
jgi:hypothetical protein